MNAREKFLANMAFEPDVPLLKWEYGYWAATIRRWYKEGLRCEEGIPDNFDGGLSVRAEKMGYKEGGVIDKDVNKQLGLDEPQYRIPVNNFIYPLFERKILEDHADWFVYQDGWGVTKQEFKDRSTPEKIVSGPVKTVEDWEKLKERLQPAIEGRLPENWKELCQIYKENDRLLVLGGGHGFFGTPRYLFGDTEVLYAFHDKPKLIHNINDYLCNFWIELYSRVLQDVKPDVGFIWEDMCYRNGPLISPKMFEEYMLPYYKKLCGFFRDNGINIIHVDTDGNAWKLIPLFLEGGVTGLFPMEVAAGMDVVKLRETFPKLQMIGGVDKMELMKDQGAIDRELERRIFPTMLKGGYIPMVDHLVPPEVSWENFEYYRTRLNQEIDR
jgi:uroporphyrinogen-III decarboxylase